MIRNLLFIFLISMVVTAESQQSQSPNEPVKKIKLDARRPVRLDYKSQAWNKDPLKVETSAILVRDSHTGRLAKIVVTETGANTGMFVGYIS